MGFSFFKWKKKASAAKSSRFSSDGTGSQAVKNFGEDQAREDAYDARARGLRTVPLDRIVGSVGRYMDFDKQFRMRGHLPSERLERVKQAMREGRPLPPVKLYQIKEEYYVLDGNHRIAAAKEMGHDDILAKIVEFVPSQNSLENILYRERADFTDRTRLTREIQLTEVGGYAKLLRQIAEHRAFLQREKWSEMGFEEAAADWYRTIYRPLTAIIRKARMADSFPDRTLADLYVYISVHQWEGGRRRSYGSGINKSIPKNMQEFRRKMMGARESDYPEMTRGITVFVLINVQGKKEKKIVEKLTEFNEIREIHSVHGDVDLLVKIILTRSLLSSDAEVISEFVHTKIRQIPGIISTKTLIPGQSHVKGENDAPKA